jgi:hypothetical protein
LIFEQCSAVERPVGCVHSNIGPTFHLEASSSNGIVHSADDCLLPSLPEATEMGSIFTGNQENHAPTFHHFQLHSIRNVIHVNDIRIETLYIGIGHLQFNF